MQTDWLDYIRDRFPLYFRLGYMLPRQRRNRGWCLLALAGEGEHVLRHVSEAAVALIRLQWWIEQLERMEDRPHAHPLLDAVRKEFSQGDMELARDLFEGFAVLVESGNPMVMETAYARLLGRLDDSPVERHAGLAQAWSRHRIVGRWVATATPERQAETPKNRLQRALTTLLKHPPEHVPALGRLWISSLLTVSYK